MANNDVDISAVILCYNEEDNIRHCLEAVKGFCEIYVVDSFSSDRTLDIAREYTENIVSNKYVNHAAQWQWALDNLDIKTTWVLALDADFVLTADLKREIKSKLPHVPDGVDGIYVKHRYVFGGRQIRFGGMKQYWLRIIRRGKASSDASDLVDFRFNVMGRTVRFKSAVIEYNRHDDDASVWLAKQDKFSLRLAVEEELRRRKLLDWESQPSLFGNSDERIMWLRNVWLSLPLFFRPFIYFIYRYFLTLGFLDGRAGFLYHFMQGWWLRCLVDWKVMQLRKLNLHDEDLERFKEAMLEVRSGSVRHIWEKLKESREARSGSG